MTVMRHKVMTVPVSLPHRALPEGDWADAYRAEVAQPFLTARAAGETAFAAFPFWVMALMAIRNFVVAPFGLKTGNSPEQNQKRVGFFPIISDSKDELVVGLNDKHLDFRIVIDLAERNDHQDVTVSTIIDRHNLLGRVYLAMITPFHKLILHTAMTNLSRAAQNQSRD